MNELIKTYISKTHNILQFRQENSPSIPVIWGRLNYELETKDASLPIKFEK